MGAVKIPFSDQNDFIVEAELDEMTCFLHLAWNDDESMWTLSLENAENDVILSGIRLVSDWPLLGRFRHLAVPKGEMVVVAVDNEPLGRQSFIDGSAELVYLPAQAT